MRTKYSFMKSEKGQILPLLLVAMVVGTLFMLPSLRYVGTHVRATQVLEENVQGLYAADAGIEAAFRWIMTDWAGQSLGSSTNYWTNTLTENGMTVDVTVTATNTILGGKVASKGNNPPDQHTDWLSVNTKVNWTPAPAGSPAPYLYTFTMDMTNLAQLNMWIDAVWLGLQDGTYYIGGSTTCNSTSVYSDDPTQTGGGSSALLLVWGDPENPKKLFEIEQDTTVIFTLQVYGPPPDLDLPSGLFFYDAVMPNETSIGAMIGNNQYSYFLITSTARNQKGVQAIITSHVVTVNVLQSETITGVSKIRVMDWQVKP